VAENGTGGDKTNGEHPKVFISYSHDSKAHEDRVLEFSNRLRGNGIDCEIDQYVVSPPEGWPLWMEGQIETAEFVIMVCTETYFKRVKKDTPPGVGRGVMWEGMLIYQHIYDDGSNNAKFIPVLFSDGKYEHIPRAVRGASHYIVDKEEDYEKLYRHLTKQPINEKPELGKLRALSIKERKYSFAIPWNIPQSTQFFTGRQDILDQLKTTLVSGGVSAITQRTQQTQVVRGMGGIGKTQTALEYARINRDDYKAGFWVVAGTRESIISGYVEIAKILDLPEKDAQDQGVTASAVKKYLEGAGGWLLVLDNVDDPSVAQEFIPKGGAGGHVIMTSRARAFDAIGKIKPIEIDKMEPDEAVEFLLKRTSREGLVGDELLAVNELALELDYLPLALEQAGAYIFKIGLLFREYLNKYRKVGVKLFEKGQPTDYDMSVLTTWEMNFKAVEELSKVSADMLRVCAFYDSVAIPVEIFAQGAAMLGDNIATANLGDNIELSEALANLEDFSLIGRDIYAKTFKIHRLVQAVTRDRMGDDEARRLWAGRAVRGLNDVFQSAEFEVWDKCERLIGHVVVCGKYIDELELEFNEAGRLLNNAGYYLNARGRYEESEPLFKRSLAICEKALGPEHPDTATSINNLAELYRAQGRYEESEPLYKRSLAISEKALGPEHPDTATSINNLAELYRAQGRYEESEPLYKRSLAICEKALGPEHPDTATSINNLAGLYYSQGRYEESEPLYKRSLAIREKALGPEHPDTATSINNLAFLYFTLKQYDKAEPLLIRSLAIREKTLGLAHPDTANALWGCANVSAALGRMDEARKYQARAEESKKLHAQINKRPGK
jgi:tetratricopeptide (TPR) repeat protein